MDTVQFGRDVQFRDVRSRGAVAHDVDTPTQLAGIEDETADLEPPDWYRMLQAAPDDPFDRVVELAAGLFQVPFATVSIVAEDRVWFRARQGVQLTDVPCWPGLAVSALSHDGLYLVHDATEDPRCAGNPLIQRFGLNFYAAAPILNSAGQAIGVVDIADSQPRALGAWEQNALRGLAAIVQDELRLREMSARRADLERTFSTQQHRVGVLYRNLQESLLPRHPVEMPHLDVATMYVPAAGEEAAGDFYDVFPLRDGRWVVTVADVPGRGVPAIAQAAQLRASLRTAALHHGDPGRVLADANYELMLDQEPSALPGCSTAVVALLEPRPGGCRVTLARGGHPPPLVATAAGDVELLLAQGPVLGAYADATYKTVAVDMAAGDALIAYTDGLTLPGDEDDPLGNGHLADVWRGAPGADARWFVECARETLIERSTNACDDAALVVIRVRGLDG
ncbi:MAG: GAF domain-containing SpoIIE family protein phosphatase [Actinocatenispora sp.]